jgi:glycosyltransferase involved in cell wall biosynthesis
VPDDALVCLFAGKLVEKKRPFDFLRALERLRGRNIWALFVGDGELRASVQGAAQRMGVQARFLGFLNQSEIPAAYAACDVLVLPSDARETWGLVVNEAMASGRTAIVSHAVGCAPDLVVPGQTGHVFPLGDAERLARCIQQLDDDRDLSVRMGNRAREHVSAFSAGAAAEGILRALRGPAVHVA